MIKFRITPSNETVRYKFTPSNETVRYKFNSVPIFTVSLIDARLLINVDSFLLINSTDILEIDG
jgi:hypothetical protein